MVEFAVVGLFVGALSRLINRRNQSLKLLNALVLGLIGSLLGAVATPLLGVGALFDLNVGGLIAALTGSVLLIGMTEIITGLRSS